jgi:hypothetical protein
MLLPSTLVHQPPASSYLPRHTIRRYHSNDSSSGSPQIYHDDRVRYETRATDQWMA